MPKLLVLVSVRYSLRGSATPTVQPPAGIAPLAVALPTVQAF